MDGHGVEQVRALYAAHRKELLAYALALAGTQPAAEDAVHSAFEKVLAKPAAPDELRPYVYRCIRNAAIDQHRRNGRAAAERVGSAAPEPLALRLDLQEALTTLSEDERDAVVLKTWSGLTFQEIGEVRQVSLNTAASWYRRGLEKLRARFQEVEQ